MHRIDHATAAPGALFTEGNPAAATPATTVTDDWLNDMQENLAQLVEAASIALVKGDGTQVFDAIQALINNSAQPAGSVVYVAKNTAPTGYLKANGAAVSRTVYAALFAAIGTTFGAGDGATTFGLPDLRGEFPRGWDDGRGVDSGREFGSAQADAFKSHSHSGSAATGHLYNAGSTYTAYDVFSGQTGNTGGAETRPRNIALLACIKY